MSRSIFIAIISFACILSACKKTDSFTLEPINDYYPLTVGKYITYDLDSLVFTNFGTELDTFHYQVKYAVDAPAVDNLNRSGFSVIRYIRFDSTFNWMPDHTDFVLNTGHSLEFTEDNIKYIKLSLPFEEGFSWQGNAYIDINQTDLSYLKDWSYTYDSLNVSTNIGSLKVDSTITVIEANDSTLFPINLADSSVATKTYSVEKYAKHIGLVYRNFFYQEYQERFQFNDPDSYGIILTMIDHN